MERRSFVDHAWDSHNFNVGQEVDLSKCPVIESSGNGARRNIESHIFWLNGVGLIHVFIKTNPIDRQGFVLYENENPVVRELTDEELLSKLAAVYVSAYVFDGQEYYDKFKPNPLQRRKQVQTDLRCQLHFPDGKIFHSDGDSIGAAMETGPDDKTLRLSFERWNFEGGEKLPVYLPNSPEFFVVKPKFVRLEQSGFINNR